MTRCLDCHALIDSGSRCPGCDSARNRARSAQRGGQAAWIATTGYRGWAYCSGPAASPYRGIMSYCDDHLTFGAGDRLMHGWY